MQKKILFVFIIISKICYSNSIKYFNELELDIINIEYKINLLCKNLNEEYFNRQEWTQITHEDVEKYQKDSETKETIDNIETFISDLNDKGELAKLFNQIKSYIKYLTELSGKISFLADLKNQKSFEKILKLNFEKFKIDICKLYELLNLTLDNCEFYEVPLIEIIEAINCLENKALARQLEYIFRNEANRFLYDVWLFKKDISKSIVSLDKEFDLLIHHRMKLAELEGLLKRKLK